MITDRVFNFVKHNQPVNEAEIHAEIGCSLEVLRLAFSALKNKIYAHHGNYRLKGLQNKELYSIVAKRAGRPVNAEELAEMARVNIKSARGEVTKSLVKVYETKLNKKRCAYYAHPSIASQFLEPFDVKSIPPGVHNLKMRANPGLFQPRLNDSRFSI